MLGVSGSYSQNGGWSYNHMGVSFSKNGVSFSPSVGVSTVLYGKEYSYLEAPNDYIDTGERFKDNKELHAQINAEIGNTESIQNDLNTKIVLSTSVLKNGWMIGSNGKNIFGVTTRSFGLFSGHRSKISISPGVKGLKENGKSLVKTTIVHEMIHAYHYNMYLNGKITEAQYNAYTESVAYAYSLAYFKSYGMDFSASNARSHITTPYPVKMSYRPLSTKYNIW